MTGFQECALESKGVSFPNPFFGFERYLLFVFFVGGQTLDKKLSLQIGRRTFEA